MGNRLWSLAADFDNSNDDVYAAATHHHQYVEFDVYTPSYDIIHPNHYLHPNLHLHHLASSDHKQCAIEYPYYHDYIFKLHCPKHKSYTD